MAECSCIKGNYNFYVKSVDRDTIVYQDLSDWMDDEGYQQPSGYDVQLTPPKSSASISLPVSVGVVNKISSVDVGEILDGIYCFQTTSCGTSYVKSIAIFPKIECCVKQAWINLGMEYQERIEEVENHLKLSTINAELNNVLLASQELDIAQKLLENLKCDCDC
jgi:hypothetical protein